MPLNRNILKQAMKARKVFDLKTEETLYLKKNMFLRKVDFNTVCLCYQLNQLEEKRNTVPFLIPVPRLTETKPKYRNDNGDKNGSMGVIIRHGAN